MNRIIFDAFTIKLIVIFAVTLSIASLPGSTAGHLQVFPSIQSVSATIPTALPQPWNPAGPALSTETVNIFYDQTSELFALCSGAIDLTDFPLHSSQDCVNAPNVVKTSPVSSNDHFEIEFNLANNLWGVPFQFGNNLSGVQIRQGIAHLFDKQVFTSTDPEIAGSSTPIDDPLPPSNGLPAAIPCTWDGSFPESGSNCTVGASGGTAYHLATASGLCGSETSQTACQYPWMQGFGSTDFCAAAQHFILAGLATGKDSNCVLMGVNKASIVAHPVNFIAKSDRPARFRLATGLSEEICALITGSFSEGCIEGSPGTGCVIALGTSLPPNAALCLTSATGYPLCVFDLPPTSVNTCWGMYTGGFGSESQFDSSLYYGYNSLFVLGGSFDHPPCASTTASNYPSNYMYLCVPAYDSSSNQMEFAPCLSALGDPTPGQTSPTFATCPSSSKLTGVSAGYKAEDVFGQGAYTIPIYSDRLQFAYLSNWSRVINAEGVGLPNYFTWMDAHSPNPGIPGTVRQGFYTSTSSLNPYTPLTTHDLYILNSIYDTLYKSNPMNPNQVINWMTVSSRMINNTQLGYNPPAGTVGSVRNFLRSDLFWHDGQQVTAWDVKFTYLTAPGCSICQQLPSLISGVTVLSPTEFDIHFTSIGLFIQQVLGSLTIVPGHIWSICGSSTWNSLLASSASDVNGPAPVDKCMSLNTIILNIGFDPIQSNVLIGSGPWVCKSSTGTIGGGCSTSGTQSPPPGGSINLVAYKSSAAGTANDYFRSSASLARWIWTGNTGDPGHDFNNFSTLAFCLTSQPTPTLGMTTGCGHWQQGIGAGAPNYLQSITLTSPQIPIVAFYYLVNWVSPVTWASLTGIDSTTPILYAPTAPAVASQTLSPASSVGCTAEYPTGGYDC